MSKRYIKTVLLASTVFLSSCINPFSADIFGDLFNPESTVTQSVIEAGSTNLVKVKSSSGESDVENDMKTISDEYQLTINRNDLLKNKEVKLSIPVDATLLPKNFSQANIQAEYFDEKTNTWIPDTKFSYYDEASGKVYFISSLANRIQPEGEKVSEDLETASFKTKAEGDTSQIKLTYRIRIYMFSVQVSVTKEGSNFRIFYYPSAYIGNKSRVKNDGEWKSGSGNANDPDVPNYIEDLDKVLNDAYKKLLELQNSEGNVFKPLSTPIDVYVCDTGGDAGDSPLGGPMRISNTKIESYQDLKETVAHEMVHVFQGQYYKLWGMFSGRQNRWFIEAVANYYAALATGLTDDQKKDFYGEFYNDYLSVGLQSSNDNSMYATAHFLDWLSTKYSTNIVGDALLKSSGNDLIGLSEAIKSSGESGGISTAYEEFAKYIMTNPEGYLGFNKGVKNAMSSNAVGYQYLTGNIFSDKKTYITLNKSMDIMSMVYAGLSSNSNDDSLLVIDSSASSGSLMKSYTYDFVGETNSSYKNKIPIDSYDTVPSRKSITIKNFGRNSKNKAFEQLIYNYSPASKSKADVKYYILRAPKITYQGNNTLKWTTDELGNIPKENILYDVYRGRDIILSNIRIHNKKKSEMTLTAVDLGSSSTIDPSLYDMNENMEITENLFSSSDKITIYVRDQFGNYWPERAKDQVSLVAYYESEGKFQPVSYSISTTLGVPVKLKVEVTGDTNTDVKWELVKQDASDFSPEGYPEYLRTIGTLSSSGNTATYYPVSDVPYHVNDINVGIKVTSLADPTKYISIYISVDNPDWSCIKSDSKVSMSDGSTRSIQNMKVGDEIIALDTNTNKTVKAKVEKVLTHKDKTYIIDHIKTDSNDDIEITGNHKVLTGSYEWKEVKDIKVGEVIYTYDSNSKSLKETKVISIIRDESKESVVYNLKTSVGNYFANDILIHNKCLMKGSLIETENGLLPVESIKVGDKVWANIDGQKVLTNVTNFYTKDTVLEYISGKKLTDNTSVTINHTIWNENNFIKAGKTLLPDQNIYGAVYDLKTENGNYYSDGVLMKCN